jgi:4-hydroxy-3-polyprenylbenzoate decarboxylase
MKHLKSLREYISELQSLGELQTIDVEVDLNLELAAITRRCNELGAPAPLFERIKGIKKGYRALGAPAGISRQPGRELIRLAVSLGLPPDSHGLQIVEALASAREREPLPPVEVATGPCKEVKLTGDQINLEELPAPWLHDGDGGRYINTYGIIIAQTPDKKWTNWSIARIMITGKNTMTGIVHPLQHVGMVHKAWADIGQPMPFALALGVEPAIPFVGGMPLPAFVNESDYLGALCGEALEVVRCETSDLMVPATSEIVIEGFLSNVKVAPEGPMGEYAGYLFQGPGHDQPVYEVTCITHRNDPILPVVVAGEPVEEDHTAWGVPAAAEALYELRQQRLPVTSAWIPLETAIHWLVITVHRDWKEKSGLTTEQLVAKLSEVLFRSKATIPIPKILLVNDDIDPTNLKELVWAYATRCHPGVGEILFQKETISPLVAFYRSAEKMSGHGTKAVYVCLPPDEWGDKLPVRSSFRHIYPADLQKTVIARWNEYGFSH